MSEHLFRKPAQRLTLPEAALIAGLDSRAVGAVAVVELRRRARAQPRRAGADARAGIHHGRRRRRRRARCGRASSRTGSRAKARSGWAKDYLRQQFRNEFGGDHPPDWQVHTSFDRRRAGRRGAGGRRRLAAAADAGAPGGARRASIRETGDVLAMVGGGDYARAPSTARRAAAASRARRSSRSSTPRRWRTAFRRSRCCRISTQRAPAPGDPEWTPRNAEGDAAGRADAARGAGRIEQRRRRRSAAADRHRRRCCSSRRTPACSDLPDVPSLALGTGLVSPLDLTAAYTMFPGGGEVAEPRGIAVGLRRATATEVFAQPVAAPARRQRRRSRFR